MIDKFIKIFMLAFLLSALPSCTTTVYKPSVQATMPSKKVLKLNLSQVKIDGITKLNTYCESDVKYCPKNALVKWLDDRIITRGNHGVLVVTINNAVLQRTETKDRTDKYQGSYDVTLKLFRDQKEFNDFVELNVLVENYRIISRSQNSKEKADILIEQVNELVKLLESEIIEKSNIYFSDYLIR